MIRPEKENLMVSLKATVTAARQAPGEVVDNPLGLERDKMGPVVEALNGLLASEYVLYHQYKKHHWLVQGSEYWQIHKLLDEHAASVLEYADLFAERVTALGGIPVSGPEAQARASYVEHEPEGLYDLREMLENDLWSTQVVVRRMREHVDVARGAGDYGTEHLLRETLLAQEDLTQQLEHLLTHESLTRTMR
jgi:DNA-binding ferritin-like protein